MRKSLHAGFWFPIIVSVAHPKFDCSVVVFANLLFFGAIQIITTVAYSLFSFFLTTRLTYVPMTSRYPFRYATMPCRAVTCVIARFQIFNSLINSSIFQEGS